MSSPEPEITREELVPWMECVDADSVHFHALDMDVYGKLLRAAMRDVERREWEARGGSDFEMIEDPN